jgi:soluble lytic murein transglycosylase
LACAHVNPSEAGRPALILRALNLPTLEQDYLKGAVAKESPPAELRLLLAGAYSAQDNPANAMFATLKATPGYSQMEFSDLPEEVWDLLYPKAYSTLIQTQARLNNLDPYLVMGLIRQESAFSAHALSVANARGLMQVLPQTAAETTRTTRVRLAGQRLYDPNYNVRVGCAYLAGLFKEFDGHPEFAVAAYNAGDFRVKDWVKKYTFRDQEVFLESIPITETRIYVEQVLRDADVYRQLLSNSPRFAQCSQAQPAGPVQTSSATFCDDLVSTLGERVPGE